MKLLTSSPGDWALGWVLVVEVATLSVRNGEPRMGMW